MSSDIKAPDAMHFKALELENVRGFGKSQSLRLVDRDGTASLWNLILGENGVGKTTLMQALAVMRPIPAAAANENAADAGPPPLSRAELSVYENDGIMHFIRKDGSHSTRMSAVLETDVGKRLEVGVAIKSRENELDEVTWTDEVYPLRSSGPLVIGYGAARHVGHANVAEVEARDAAESLFMDAVDLYDAEEIIEKLDHAAKSDPDRDNGPDVRRLKRLKTAVARLLPELQVEDIDFRGPRVAGRDPDRSGVHVRTPSGMTPLADLSLGYQGMFAWTVDLAWRLFNAFPASADPMSESAIVLIDEVDLHLHPRWQRDLRRRLLEQFPKVQFIATTHNPVTAQEALSEGGIVAVVRWDGTEAHILNDPIPAGEWRFDQVLTSDLFGFGSERSQGVEAKLSERLELLRNPNRTVAQDARLRELDEFVTSLPTARSPSAQRLEDLMIEFAKDFPRREAR